ncbi:hypothetical protein Ntsu_28590 [Nocardia sp. IFM 10818]
MVVVGVTVGAGVPQAASAAAKTKVKKICVKCAALARMGIPSGNRRAGERDCGARLLRVWERYYDAGTRCLNYSFRLLRIPL